MPDWSRSRGTLPSCARSRANRSSACFRRHTTPALLSLGRRFIGLFAATPSTAKSRKTSDRLSPKPVFLTGLVLSAIATALLLVVAGNISFIITLCLISLGQGLCMSSNTSLIRRLARDNPALTRASLRSLLTIDDAR